MKEIIEKIKYTLVTGVLIVLPAWLAVILLVGILKKLGVIVKPISDHAPEEIRNPYLFGFVAFIVICLLVGVMFHTAVGRAMGAAIESNVLAKIPGYSSLRAIARQATDLGSNEGFKPAFIRFDDGLTPGFLIEEHEEMATVFLPSVPTPMAGAIWIMDKDRVQTLDVPVATMMKCVSKWGAGSGDLMASLMKAPQTLADLEKT